MTASEVGIQLCELCREGRNLEAVERLYDDRVVSIEAIGAEGMPRRIEGKDQVRQKNDWWVANHEVHRAEVIGPLPHGDDRFAAIFEFDITNKNSGQRFDMKEVAIYTVTDSKITQEEFFYSI